MLVDEIPFHFENLTGEEDMKMWKFIKTLHLFLANLLKKIEKCGIIHTGRCVTKACRSNFRKTSHIYETKKTEKIKEKGLQIMCKASEVGKIVINKCIDLNLPIDVQKLQKLLVLMQVECIQRSGKQLFKEDIRVWDCGVAIKEVDEDFRFNKTAFKEKNQEYINLLDVEEACVDYILREYGEKNAFELNALYVNQNVLKLGVIKQGDTVPHISFGVLIGVFGSV